MPCGKGRRNGQLANSACSLYDPVKPRIAANGTLVKPYTIQQLQGMLILNKDVSKTPEHVALQAAIPLKKALLLIEYCRHKENGNMARGKVIEIVIPEFILYK